MIIQTRKFVEAVRLHRWASLKSEQPRLFNGIRAMSKLDRPRRCPLDTYRRASRSTRTSAAQNCVETV